MMILPKDRKFGQVDLENPGRVGPDEPVFVFRAKDLMVLAVLREYRRLCELAGSPAQHIAGITEAIITIDEWQKIHGTKVPD